jgi:hypothetical protein
MPCLASPSVERDSCKPSATTYLRSGMLPNPIAITRVGLLPHYVDARSISTTVASMRLPSTRRGIVPDTHLPGLQILKFGWIREHKERYANYFVISAISRKESRCEHATGRPHARKAMPIPSSGLLAACCSQPRVQSSRSRTGSFSCRTESSQRL